MRVPAWLRMPSWLLKEGVTATDRRRIIRGTLHSFLIQGISIGLVFGSNLWLVRSSDTTAYGNYVHVFNWVSILSVLVMGGRDDLVIAQLPKYLGAGKHGHLLRLVQKANGFIFLSALLICGVPGFFHPPLSLGSRVFRSRIREPRARLSAASTM